MPTQTFIEFGVENYVESNTRFLMMNNNWRGLVMDGSSKHIDAIKSSEYYWKYDLTAHQHFITKENINSILASQDIEPEVGILHIDIDGNDYWIWREISVISPSIVIMEYNSVFGKDRAITVPYDASFLRSQAHYSNLYAGASLPALVELAHEKGYACIGSNSAGNNAYFVRRDKLPVNIVEVPLELAYVQSRFREGRTEQGELNLLGFDGRQSMLRGLPVFNTRTKKLERF